MLFNFPSIPLYVKEPFFFPSGCFKCHSIDSATTFVKSSLSLVIIAKNCQSFAILVAFAPPFNIPLCCFILLVGSTV